MIAYVDGSFKRDKTRWAFVIVENDKAIHEGHGKLPPVYNQYRQIGGELFAVKQALEWSKSKGQKLHIFYDYTGIEMWATNQWRANNPLTKKYKLYMAENKKWVQGFTKVKSHTGNKWNEYVDQLM